MLNKKLIPAIVAFFITLLVLVLTIFIPKSLFSEAQNKSLTPIPAFSLENLFTGSLDSSVQRFLSDHVFFKDSILAFKNNAEVLLLKNQINGVLITEEKMADNPNITGTIIAQENTDAILKLMDKFDNPENFLFALIPTAIEIHRDDFSNASINFDQLDFISQTYTQFQPGQTIDMSTGLLAQKDKNIYYNSHNNWTSLGAYSGYGSLSSSLSFTAASRGMFDVEFINDIFYGDLYNKTLIKWQKEDTIDIYKYANNSVTATVKVKTENGFKENTSILFREYLETSQKQKVFLGEDSAEVTIQTSVDNDRKLLIFKDDYSDPLMQFLQIHYEEIRLIDLDLADEQLLSSIDFSEYTNVLFLYNVIDYVEDNIIAEKLLSLI